jgi:hypothetical protein
MSSISAAAEITPKSCTYGCGVDIYWNTGENTYFEVFTENKHVCPNRSKSISQSNTAKPSYYNKFTKQPKQKMSNSFELLTGSVSEIQKKYEILSDIVTEYNGKVHGSQSHIIANNNISFIVYYEVPAESNKREEVKKKFENFTGNKINTYQRN